MGVTARNRDVRQINEPMFWHDLNACVRQRRSSIETRPAAVKRRRCSGSWLSSDWWKNGGPFRIKLRTIM
jgi:hypothetical protein